SGTERWRRAEPACSGCASLGAGVAPDASLCWTTRREGSLAIVRSFSCKTGALTFERSLPLDPGTAYEGLVTGFVPSPPGILVVAKGRATVLAPTGEPRWEREVGPGVLLLPTGARVASFPLALSPFQTLERVDPATGTALGRELVAPGREVRVSEE